mmetsp:Transcript_19862/g.44166  ORF Transcript_19862/g.44166 Transcript_19862/m.44166 type:complete len:102 (+) Transcript_19862:78-383(+)
MRKKGTICSADSTFGTSGPLASEDSPNSSFCYKSIGETQMNVRKLNTTADSVSECFQVPADLGIVKVQQEVRKLDTASDSVSKSSQVPVDSVACEPQFQIC